MGRRGSCKARGFFAGNIHNSTSYHQVYALKSLSKAGSSNARASYGAVVLQFQEDSNL